MIKYTNNYIHRFIYIFFIFSLISLTYAEKPVLLFSDMESGPNSGWSDSDPNKGASITIWGRNLEESRGLNYVTVGGVDLNSDSDYAVWGESWPTPFYQKITFWLNDAMTKGISNITVTINGETSEPLNFTIREGRIFFVSNGPNGNGSIESPFKNSELTKYGALNYGLMEGDILYYRGQTYKDAQYGANGLIRFEYVNSNNDMPFSLIAYPNEKPKVIYPGNSFGMAFRVSGNSTVISGFEIEAEYSSVGLSNYGRLIGNDLIGLTKKSNGGTAIVTTSGDANKIFGNAIHGGRSGWRLDHATYFSGCSPIEGNYLGWNYIYDNDFGRGPIISINHQQDRCAPDTEILKSHFIFNNIVKCDLQRAKAVGVYDLSYDEGEPEPEPIFIYNNIFSNCGTLDLVDKSNVGWSPSFGTSSSRGHSRFYHNILYNGNYVGFQIGVGELSTYFKNNIIVMNSSGILGDTRPHQYIINDNFGKINTDVSNNLFYDIGEKTMNLNDLDLGINWEGLDPLFVDPNNLDFSLNELSPVIDKGSNDLIFDVPLPSFAPISKDMFGNNRVGNYDLGAIEGVSKTCTTNSECNDNLFCNGFETCSNNFCVSGLIPIVLDDISCTVDSCNEVLDKIENIPDDLVCDDGDDETSDVCSIENKICENTYEDLIQFEFNISGDVHITDSTFSGRGSDTSIYLINGIYYRFNLSNFILPENSTFYDAKLKLYTTTQYDDINIHAYLVNTSWVEGDSLGGSTYGATREYYDYANVLLWNNFLGDWFDKYDVSQGNDYFDLTTLIDDDTEKNVEINLKNIFSKWVNGDISLDNGIFLTRANDIRLNSRPKHNFYSKEHSNPNFHPKLILTFKNLSDEMKDSCTTNWRCGDWNTCLSNSQDRVCTDLNNCETIIDKPIETQTCVINGSNNVCESNLDCGDYGACVNNFKSRSCYDLNTCNLNNSYTNEIISCTVSSSENNKKKNTGSDRSSSTDGSDISNVNNFKSKIDTINSDSLTTKKKISIIDNLDNDNMCISEYTYTKWRACFNNSQNRIIKDLKKCESNRFETRKCEINNSELDNLFLNAKPVNIKSALGKNIYKTNLDNGYNEIIVSDYKLKDELFVIIDEITGNEYFGRLVDTKDNSYYYKLERLDEYTIGLLKENNLVESSYFESFKESINNIISKNSILKILIVFFILSTVYLIISYIKQIHKKSEKHFDKHIETKLENNNYVNTFDNNSFNKEFNNK